MCRRHEPKHTTHTQPLAFAINAPHLHDQLLCVWQALQLLMQGAQHLLHLLLVLPCCLHGLCCC